MSLAFQKFTHDGLTKTVAEWCDFYGISYNTIKSRHTRGAVTFEKLFKIRPAQVRYKQQITAETAERFLGDRTVDLLELLFDESLRGQILQIAQLDRERGYHFGRTEWGEPERKYSVRDTLSHLIWRGIRSWNKDAHDLEVLKAQDAEDFKLRHPEGLPEVTKGGGTIGWRTDEVRTQSRESPHRTWDPVTEQDIIDIFGE